MFNNTSTIKTLNEINNNQTVVLYMDIQSRSARIEMTGDEWQDIHGIVSRQTKHTANEKTIGLRMIFLGRKALLTVNKKEYKCLQETIYTHNQNKNNNSKEHVSMQMTLGGRPARVDMSKSELARWICLVEAVDIIEQKCSEFGTNMSDNFWIQPIAMQKYMDSRFETMLDEVNHHEFGIDTKIANMNILKRRQENESANELQDEEFENRYSSVCTS